MSKATRSARRLLVFGGLLVMGGGLWGSPFNVLPFAFEANRGQTDNQVRFLARGEGYGLFLTSSEAVLALKDGSPLRLRWEGTRSAPRVSGERELPGRSHYLIGNDPARWRQGNRLKRPVSYQEIGGVRREVASGWRRIGGGRLGFEVGEHDPARPLVIDPVLVYSTYLGGSSLEEGHAIAVDPAGNAYVTGFTYSNSGRTATAGATAGSTTSPSRPGTRKAPPAPAR